MVPVWHTEACRYTLVSFEIVVWNRSCRQLCCENNTDLASRQNRCLQRLRMVRMSWQYTWDGRHMFDQGARRSSCGHGRLWEIQPPLHIVTRLSISESLELRGRQTANFVSTSITAFVLCANMPQRLCAHLRPPHPLYSSCPRQFAHQQRQYFVLVAQPISYNRSHQHRRSRAQPVCQVQQRHASSSMRESRANTRRPTQPSIAVMQSRQQRLALESGEMPDDIGLLPGTLVMPTGRNRPAWLGNFRDRWMLEKRRWWTRFVGLIE